MEDQQDLIIALRSAHQHQVQLTTLADQKANINIGFISLVGIFLSNSPLLQMIKGDFVMQVGFVVFAILLTLSLVMALAVVVPRLGRSRISKASEMGNPLYFGMFTQIPRQDYVDYMVDNLQTNEQARSMLASDIYQIGQVLKRKYRSLRISYVFLGLSVFTGVLLYCYLVFSGNA